MAARLIAALAPGAAVAADVVNLLIRAAQLTNPVYLRQISADNPQARVAIARTVIAAISRIPVDIQPVYPARV
jgi:hypothetical protein